MGNWGSGWTISCLESCGWTRGLLSGHPNAEALVFALLTRSAYSKRPSTLFFSRKRDRYSASHYSASDQWPIRSKQILMKTLITHCRLLANQYIFSTLQNEDGPRIATTAFKGCLFCSPAGLELLHLMRQLACVVLLFCTLSPCAVGTELDPAEAFKEFLSHSQTIKEVTFLQKRCEDAKAMQCFTGSTDGTNFFLREHLLGENVHTLLSPTNQMRVPYFVGAAGQKQWEIAELTVFESEESSDVLSRRAQHGMGILVTALAFGLPSVKPSSFVWESNQFTAMRFGPVPQGLGNVIRGEIIVSNRFPVRLDSPEAGVTVYYDYADERLPAGVPSAATVCLYGRMKSDCLMVTAIQRFETGGVLPEGYFEPYRHIAAQYLGVNRSISGRQTTVKDNTYAVSHARLKGTDPKTTRARLVILWILIVLSVAFIAFALYQTVKRARRRHSRSGYEPPS